jgi:hypothetical protein
MVVREERALRRAFAKVKEPEVDALLPWLPHRISVRSDLARALSDFVVARRRFSPPGRAQLAEPLAKVLRQKFGLSPQAPADAVLCAVYHRVFIGE